MDTELKNEELLRKAIENYRFCEQQVEDAKALIKKHGLTIESASNGLIRNPAVQIQDTYLKQMKIHRDDIIKLRELLGIQWLNNGGGEDNEPEPEL
ncbi:P27 family phage terminase small subunit [Culicoidibacter larvae]|nr:P27 family phage terminase small subunit [Culicoidibacter larvae]